MVDFKKLDKYIEYIEEGKIPDIFTFNEFAIEFYNTSKVVPLSKYLKSKNRTTKLPKIMNMKKAGEVLNDTQKDSSDVRNFLRRKGYVNIPELNYTCIMVLRKIDLTENWKKLLIYFGGDKTITEINNSTKVQLFPEEIQRLEEFIMETLNIDDTQLNKLLNFYKQIDNDRDILKAIKKLSKQI